MTIARIWTKETIIAGLENNPIFLEKAILAMFERQTKSEQQGRHTNSLNGVGFSKFHNKIAYSLANHIKLGGHLQQGWLDKARKIMVHYAGQLVEIANQNETNRVNHQ